METKLPGIGSLALVLLTFSVPVAAQPRFRPYVGATVGSVAVDADDVDGRSLGPGAFGGVSLAKYVDVEVDLVLPTSTFRRSYTGPSVAFPGPGSGDERLTVITQFDKEREIGSSVSVVVILRPPLERRVRPGFIIGVTNQAVEDRASYTPVDIPDGVDPEHPAVIAREESLSRNIGGPTFGAQLAISLTPQLSVVPDFRYDYMSIGDEINNAWRASVRASWRF